MSDCSARVEFFLPIRPIIVTPFFFTEGIIWALNQINLDKKLNTLTRRKAIKKWDYSVISKKYENLYKKIIFNKS